MSSTNYCAVKHCAQAPVASGLCNMHQGMSVDAVRACEAREDYNYAKLAGPGKDEPIDAYQRRLAMLWRRMTT